MPGGTRYRWQIVVPVDPADPFGAKRRVSRSGFVTKKSALEDLRKAQGNVKSLRAAVPSRMNFEKFALEWLEGQTALANSTIYGYRKIIRTHLIPKLGSLSLNEITPTLLSRLYVHLNTQGRKDEKQPGGPLNKKTVSKIHMVLRSIMEQALEDGLISSNPCRSSRLTRQLDTRKGITSRPEIAVYSDTQMALSLKWIREVQQDYLYPLWHLISFSGMRRGEALAIRWSDIDWKNSSVSVVRSADAALSKSTKATKTYKNRLVILDSETLEILKKYKLDRARLGLAFVNPEAFVFGTLKNELRGPNDVTAHWSRLISKLAMEYPQMPRVTLKGLRHSHATQLLAAGVNPKIVQERLGHSNISTTLDTYSHVTPTIQRDAVEQLMNFLGGATRIG
jgi:integrase